MRETTKSFLKKWNGAKHFRSDSHTPKDRFEHCSPFRPVMWHAKASLLQLCYHLLYKSESILQVGTLKYFRETYNRKNVTPKKVVDCFEGSEEFFISVGKSYIVAALLEFFGMKSVDDQPTNYTIPSNFTSAKKKSKERLF